MTLSISSTLDQLHKQARANRWLWLFAIFTRIALAAGFIPSGLVKIMGERFTSLSVNHPMGNYLEAVYHTGFYYTFIGVLQVTAAILLLIPRTAILGAFIYFPIILNICILSIAVRFEGSFVTSPLMVLANLYLLCWYYHKWKFILPFNRDATQQIMPGWKELDTRFPTLFFLGVIAAFSMVILFARFGYELMPRNTAGDCKSQCEGSNIPQACSDFCDCIHQAGQPLDKCLDAYNQASRK
jgi:uncharacterized membrane protein YphA (DoxX/SURF4 family)